MTKEQQQGLATPITPETFTDQLPQPGEPVWKRGLQGEGGFGPLAAAGGSRPGGGGPRLTQLLDPNRAGGAGPTLGPSGRPAGKASGFSPASQIRWAAGPGQGGGNPTGVPSGRLRSLVEQWEELHGQPATDLIRSKLVDYLQQRQV